MTFEHLHRACYDIFAHKLTWMPEIYYKNYGIERGPTSFKSP